MSDVINFVKGAVNVDWKASVFSVGNYSISKVGALGLATAVVVAIGTAAFLTKKVDKTAEKTFKGPVNTAPKPAVSSKVVALQKKTATTPGKFFSFS